MHAFSMLIHHAVLGTVTGGEVLVNLHDIKGRHLYCLQLIHPVSPDAHYLLPMASYHDSMYALPRNSVGLRWITSQALRDWEQEHAPQRFQHSRGERGPGQLSAQALDIMQRALNCAAAGLHGEGGTNRLPSLLRKAKKSKAHTKLLLAGETSTSFIANRHNLAKGLVFV